VALWFRYRKSLFDRSTIEWLLTAFRQLLERLVADPAQRIDALAPALPRRPPER
jgi:hypothetical protein